MTMTPEEATRFAANLDRLVGAVEEVLLGKNRVIRLAFTALLSDGHLLLEDVPGTGKTSLARAMAQSVDGGSNRVQFTPDLLPGDITGVSVYDHSPRAATTTSACCAAATAAATSTSLSMAAPGT